MIVKLLTEHHLEFLSFQEAAEARPSLHLSKYWKFHAAAHFIFILFLSFFSSKPDQHLNAILKCFNV